MLGPQVLLARPKQKHFDLDPHNNSAMRPEFTFLDSRAPFMGQCTLVVKDIAFNTAF